MTDSTMDATDSLQPRPPRRQTLGYSRKPLPDHIFAVVRLSWFKEGRPQEVDEFQIVERTNNPANPFVEFRARKVVSGKDT